jgi:hypothetical protein
MARRAAWLALALFAALAPPAAAQHLGVGSVGLRAGFGDDPDQVLFGFTFDLGEVAPRLRLQPSIDYGAGDHDIDSWSLLAPVHYRFPPLGAFNPYAGGGLHLAYLDAGGPSRRDRSDFDIAPVAVGGFDFPLGRKTGLQRLSLELELGGGEAYDARVVFAVMF